MRNDRSRARDVEGGDQRARCRREEGNRARTLDLAGAQIDGAHPRETDTQDQDGRSTRRTCGGPGDCPPDRPACNYGYCELR